MKKFRIITDSFLGYEIQVRYSFFPFKWFQLNCYKGINSFTTPAEAIEFINDEKMGAHKDKRTYAKENFQLEFKSFLDTGVCSTSNETWQKRFMEYLIQRFTTRLNGRIDQEFSHEVNPLLSIRKIITKSKNRIGGNGTVAYYV